MSCTEAEFMVYLINSQDTYVEGFGKDILNVTIGDAGMGDSIKENSLATIAQIKAMKKVAGSLKLLYSQYRELQSFAQFGSDLDRDTKERLAQGERIVAILKQPNNSPVPVEHQVCIIYAVVNGYLKDVPVDQIPAFEKGFARYMEINAHKVLRAIVETKKLDEDTEESLKQALTAYLGEFKAK